MGDSLHLRAVFRQNRCGKDILSVAFADRCAGTLAYGFWRNVFNLGAARRIWQERKDSRAPDIAFHLLDDTRVYSFFYFVFESYARLFLFADDAWNHLAIHLKRITAYKGTVWNGELQLARHLARIRIREGENRLHAAEESVLVNGFLGSLDFDRLFVCAKIVNANQRPRPRLDRRQWCCSLQKAAPARQVVVADEFRIFAVGVVGEECRAVFRAGPRRDHPHPRLFAALPGARPGEIQPCGKAEFRRNAESRADVERLRFIQKLAPRVRVVLQLRHKRAQPVRPRLSANVIPIAREVRHGCRVGCGKALLPCLLEEFRRALKPRRIVPQTVLRTPRARAVRRPARLGAYDVLDSSLLAASAGVGRRRDNAPRLAKFVAGSLGQGVQIVAPAHPVV